MKIDKHKLARQKQVIERWKKNKARGSLEAVTGFGKTFVAILVIKEMNEKRPERNTLVIVPTKYLQKQWLGLVESFELKHVEVKVINSAIKESYQCSLLVLDEIHNYASNSFKAIFRTVKYSFILGLTATLERMDNRHLLINGHCPVIDSIGMREALDNNYVSDFRVFNLGIEMSPADQKTYKSIGDKFYKYFAMFSHDFDTAMRCLSDESFCAMYAKKMGWDTKDTKLFAINFNRNMQLRKKFLYFAPSKVEAAVKLINTFKVPTITFSQSTEFCDSIMSREPGLCVTYHSKMKAKEKRASMERFKDDKDTIRVINTAKALDEGFDISGIVMGIICSGTSSPRQDLQRTGRAIRYSEGKLGMVINLYIKGTQDEKWLRARQKNTENIVYVNSVDEIVKITNQLKTTIV